jgi:hypothetical protein
LRAGSVTFLVTSARIAAPDRLLSAKLGLHTTFRAIATTLLEVHPIERLRYVARASEDAGPSLLVREAAGALASFSSDPAALVTACRRLVDRQPQAGAIWWLAARVLGSPDPAFEAWSAADEVESDQTTLLLVENLPEAATVVVLGWPELIAPALAKRGDLDVLVIDTADQGHGLARRLDRLGNNATLVDERGLGAAVGACDLVLLEAQSFGGSGATALPGSRAAAAVAVTSSIPVWTIVGVGRVLPGRMWDAYLGRLDDSADPWDGDLELVPANLLGTIAGPRGLQTHAETLLRADCPVAPELLKSIQ